MPRPTPQQLRRRLFWIIVFTIGTPILIFALGNTKLESRHNVILIEKWLSLISYAIASFSLLYLAAHIFLKGRKPGAAPKSKMDIYMNCCLVITMIFMILLAYDALLQVLKH
jgi:purine-cytosine permease-like protein